MRLFTSDLETGNAKYFRDQPLVIEVPQSAILPVDPMFPMTQTDLDTINQYIWSGKNEDQVKHEWTKLYHHRIFDEPNNQMLYLLEKLKSPQPVSACQISLWDKSVDQSAKISPCAQILWARRRFDAVELHVHAHSCDAYRKLLMNIQEFMSLHAYIARESGLKVGCYYHFIDSCHVRAEDREEVSRVVAAIIGSSITLTEIDIVA